MYVSYVSKHKEMVTPYLRATLFYCSTQAGVRRGNIFHLAQNGCTVCCRCKLKGETSVFSTALPDCELKDASGLFVK